MPHDSRAVVEFERASLPSSLKAAMAFMYVFFLAFMSLVYLDYPSELSAGLILVAVILVTWAVYHFVYKR